MKPTPRPSPLWLTVGLCSALPVLLSCEPDNSVAPGAPQVVSFVAQGPDGMEVKATDADGGVVEVTPRLHFTAVFDRLLDPSTLAQVTDAGLVGKGAAIKVTAPGMPTADITYVPNGDAKFTLIYPPGPSVTAQPTPTLPSGATVSATLDLSMLLAKDGKTPAVLQMGVPQTLTFQTQPFGASIDVPATPDDGGVTIAASAADGGADDGGVASADAGADDAGAAPAAAPMGTFGEVADGTFVVKIAFNNLPGDDVSSHIHVATWDTSGHPVATPMVTIAADSSDPATWTVAPAMDAKWPPGSVVSVTVDADAADPFGNKLGQAVSGTFAVPVQ